MDRLVQGLSALFLALRRRPVIRYQRTSDAAKRLAEGLYTLTYKQQVRTYLQHLQHHMHGQVANSTGMRKGGVADCRLVARVQHCAAAALAVSSTTCIMPCPVTSSISPVAHCTEIRQTCNLHTWLALCVSCCSLVCLTLGVVAVRWCCCWTGVMTP